MISPNTAHLKTAATSFAVAMTLTVSGSFSSSDDSGPSEPDSSSPTVISTGPIDGAAGAATNTMVIAMFSTAMDGATINSDQIIVSADGESAVIGSVEVSSNADGAIFTPNGHLVANTTYTATVTDAVESLEGVAMASSHTWIFTNGENKATDAAIVGRASSQTAILLDQPTADSSTGN